jgi:hypothetical protein
MRGNDRAPKVLIVRRVGDAKEKTMPTQPDAIALLKEDHRKVEQLFEQFEKARSDDRKFKIAQQICTELIVHTMIEEEIFYPALRGQVEDDTMDEAYVEHDGAKMLIAEITAGAPGAAFYEAKVSVLSEEIKHHVREEERPKDGMFAQARAAGVDLKGLAEQLKARKLEIMGEIESDGLPVPTTRSMIGASVKTGAPLEMAH